MGTMIEFESEEDRKAYEAWCKEEDEYLESIYNNPELYFCDDAAREILWDYFHEDDADFD